MKGGRNPKPAPGGPGEDGSDGWQGRQGRGGAGPGWFGPGEGAREAWGPQCVGRCLACAPYRETPTCPSGVDASPSPQQTAPWFQLTPRAALGAFSATF